MFAYVRCYLDNVFCLPCDLVSALVQQVVFSQYHARVSLRVPEVRNPGGRRNNAKLARADVKRTQ